MSARTLGDAVRDEAARLEAAKVSFGHGTTDAGQEALWLAAHVLGISYADAHARLDEPIAAAKAQALRRLVVRRIDTRKPAAYLLHEAWLGTHRFYVDERVIVPRSFIFELIEGWKGAAPARVLDLCTGSGCLAIVAALRFPGAKVDAADLSADALAVAKRNVAEYGLGDRVRLVRSDLFQALGAHRYDLIVSNPPYVKASSMRTLPQEYRREPEMALASGRDGLDHTRTILREARVHLEPRGLLMVEIGHNRKALQRACPNLAFRWPPTSAGPGYVLQLSREQLRTE